MNFLACIFKEEMAAISSVDQLAKSFQKLGFEGDDLEEMVELTLKYRELTGKEPKKKWDAEKLKEEIKEEEDIFRTNRIEYEAITNTSVPNTWNGAELEERLEVLREKALPEFRQRYRAIFGEDPVDKKRKPMDLIHIIYAFRNQQTREIKTVLQNKYEVDEDDLKGLKRLEDVEKFRHKVLVNKLKFLGLDTDSKSDDELSERLEPWLAKEKLLRRLKKKDASFNVEAYKGESLANLQSLLAAAQPEETKRSSKPKVSVLDKYLGTKELILGRPRDFKTSIPEAKNDELLKSLKEAVGIELVLRDADFNYVRPAKKQKEESSDSEEERKVVKKSPREVKTQKKQIVVSSDSDSDTGPQRTPVKKRK